jgi:predicted nucleic acid-binding protein
MTKSLLVDASFAFKLILPGPNQSRLRAQISEWIQAGHTLYAPTLWLYEITSALAKAVHFGSLTPAEAKRALKLAFELSLILVQPDESQAGLALDWTLRLKRAAAYDSFYLALAETLVAEFWTADKRLGNALPVSWVRYALE